MKRMIVVLVLLALIAPLMVLAADPASRDAAPSKEPVNLLANGSMEFWTHFNPEFLKARQAELPALDAADPLIPTRWSVDVVTPGAIARAADPHSGKYAMKLALPAGARDGSVRLGFLEVNPGSTYTFGVWVKGEGKLRVRIDGKAVEGPQQLANVPGAATDKWTHVGGKLTIPGHIRLVTLIIEASAPAALLLDDAHISAPLGKPYDADSVLRDPYTSDADTILMEDFEKAGDVALTAKAHLTDAKGGRFGRGLSLGKLDLATVPLKIPAMPDEGTLEFWFAPNNPPTGQKSDYYVNVMAGDQLLVRACSNPGELFWGWYVSDGKGGHRLEYIPINHILSNDRMSKGQWMHFAVTWDPTAVRFYLDGVLVDMHTGPMELMAVPTNVTINGLYEHLMWSGVFDELRFSKVKRYGPMVPAGDKFVAIEPQAVLAAPEEAVQEVKPPADVPARREKMLGSLAPARAGEFETKPTPDGDFIYEATSAKPAIDDIPFDIETDKLVKGLTAIKVKSVVPSMSPPSALGGAYWKLGAIPRGEYWVGVVYQSNDARKKEIPQPQLCMYLNGRIIQCSTTSDPVQVAPGCWFAELQSRSAEPLKAGDEITACPLWCGDSMRIVRLQLHTKEPVRGPNRVGINFGGDIPRTTQALGVNVLFINTRGDPAEGMTSWSMHQQRLESPKDLLVDKGTGKAVAYCRLSNPLPVPVTVDYECIIKGFYGHVAGTDKARLTLAAHSRIKREVKFALTPDDRLYSACATVKAVNPPNLGWPAVDTIEYFPGYRQSVNWDEAFIGKDMRQVLFTCPVEDTRQVTRLDDEWEMALTTDLNPPVPAKEDLKYVPQRLPLHYGALNLDKIVPRPHGGYFRRTFELPADAGDHSYRLLVGSVTDEATAYVNGKKVGNVRGQNASIVADVTEAIKPGRNELIIVVRDMLAIMAPVYVNPQAPTPSSQYLDAPGLYGNFCIGLEQISMISSPRIFARDIMVRPSVRQKKLFATMQLVNNTRKTVKAMVSVTVQDARKTVLDLGGREVTIELGKPPDFAIDKDWADPRLWCETDPHLYVLAVSVTNALTGQRLDLARERFGFRESWIENARLWFNGMPVKYKGLSNPTAVEMGGDFQLSRIAWVTNDFNLDYLDEFGYPCTQDVSGLWNTPSRHNVLSDPFWKAATANILCGEKRLYNHPSIVAWDLSNEWLWYLGYSSEDSMTGAKRFKSVGDAVGALDPSRWRFFDSDGDLIGLHDNFSFHYMNPYYWGYVMNGHSSYFPDGAFWGPLDTGIPAGQDVPLCPLTGNILLNPAKKVIMDNENLNKAGRLMPPGLTRYVGEDDVLGPGVDSGAGPIAWFWKQDIDGHRDLGTSAMGNYGRITGADKRGYMLQQFIMPDTTHHAFSGAKFTRRYMLLNDVHRKAKLTFSWKLLGPFEEMASGNGGLPSGAKDFDMGSGDLVRDTLSFNLPKVDKRTKFTLDMRLESDGSSTGSGQSKFVYGEQRDIEVWPSSVGQAPRLSKKVQLFDPQGKTAEAFKSAGIEFVPVKQLALTRDVAPWNDTVFVIGEGALDKTNAAEVAKFDAFVAAGGRVLVLTQTVTPLGLPAVTTLEPREWVSQTFPIVPTHPVLAGLSWWDLHFWAPDRVVSTGAYTNPEGGPATPLLESGAVEGMEWVEIMELYRGKGLYLLCQLPVVAKYDQEPLAREMLVRMIGYVAGDKSYRQPLKSLSAIIPAGSLVEKSLSDVGVDYRIASPEDKLTPDAVALVDAAMPAKPEQRNAWSAALEAGATIVVCNATDADSDWLTQLAKRSVKLTVPQYYMWEGRGYRNGCEQPVAGLTHQDLYWKRFDGLESASNQAEDASYTIEPLNYYAAEAQGAKELVYPRVTVEMTVGKGRLIIDQRRWMTTDEKLVRAARRNVSALMLGLGVRIAPVVAPRQLPPAIAYQPIDLSAFANRGFADEAPDDGKGGWTDQGPAADLRTFSVKQDSFQGVPFAIGKEPKCCIVLSSKSRPMPEKLPNEVSIPVGYCVEGFYFLHAAAYSSGECGLYQIQYADGTSAEIQLCHDVNIRDWISAPGPLPREKGTVSNVAWTGSCPQFRQIAVYRMLWVNPRPDVAVKAVRFANPTRTAVPVLIGLTAVVPRGQQPQAAQAAQKARDLLAKAMKAGESGHDKAAMDLLKEAIAADPSLTAAHQALGDLCERMGDENAALKAYQAWVDAGAKSPLPYNRIGEILQKRKDYKGALKAYTQSLKVEWNQPPIAEAKAQMEKAVAGQK